MKTINIKPAGSGNSRNSPIKIGRRGENEVVQVIFDFTAWQNEFGTGAVLLYVKRNGDTAAYPVALEFDGNNAIWTVTEVDTNKAGEVLAEYVYEVGTQIAKSVIFFCAVSEDIGQPTSAPPDPYETWVETLTELGGETIQNVRLAQAAQAASEAARDAAQTAQASAESSATSASGSATSAAGSATAAAGSASDASASASAASASATTASTAATQAEAAKTAAQAAQQSAADSADEAEQAAQQAHVEYEQLAEEVSDQKSALTDLQALTNRKAGMLVDTASGAIASFVPDSTVPDLLGVSVDIEPVQDLHGFDAPWPGGGGKNLLENKAVSTTKNGLTFTVNDDGTVLVNGTATENTELVLTTNAIETVGTYLVSGCPSDGSRYTYWINLKKTVNGSSSWVQEYGDSLSLTNTTIQNVGVYVASGTTCQNLLFKPMIRLATETDPTFAPYKNLCPISGWDAVEVEAAGTNLFDKTKPFAAGLINASGEVVENSAYQHSDYFTKVNPSTAYIFSGGIVQSGIYNSIAFYDENKNFISRFVPASSGVGASFTTPANCAYIKFNTVNSNFIDLDTIQLETGSTATDYHAFTGTTYTIQLGQTVYGGTLDVTNGTLTVDRAMVDLGTLTPYKTPANVFMWHVLTPTNGTILCSNYATAQSGLIPANMPDKSVCTTAAIGTYYPVALRDTAYVDATVEEMRSAMSGVQLVYELSTPFTIQLDPVTISAISGQTNNVWADAGDVSVEYAADLKHYIDSKIAAAVAALS